MNKSSLADLPQFNLSRVVGRVMKSNPDWDENHFKTVQAEYFRFLQLCKTFPEMKISAPPDIDELWHAHMLDSQNYFKDCDVYFGYYLHHDPCIGQVDLVGAQDTLSIYETAYGIKPPPAWMGLMTCANPGGGCGSMPVRSH